MTTKTCSKCKEAKTLDAFGKHKQGKGGLDPRCKECASVYTRAYYKAVSSTVIKERRAANPEVFKQRDYNTNRKRAAARTCAEEAARSSVDKARKRSDLSSVDLYGGLTYTEACTMTLPFAEERLRLEEATGIPHHIDHIISIKDGGTHTADNLQVLTASDNLAKG